LAPPKPAIIFAVAAAFVVAERVWPGRDLPNPCGWYVRAALLNGVQSDRLHGCRHLEQLVLGPDLMRISEHLPAPAEGLVACSPARSSSTSFYKHPLEIAVNSCLASFIVLVLLGGSVEGAAWFNVFAATGEMFYHANIRTPRWVGYFMQRPEHHSIHHELGVHDFNFGDITWWDRLFGTFREAPAFTARCGFDGDAERKLARMLLFQDAAGEAG
jgi:hypothetical protein